MDPDYSRKANFFKALSDETRLKILRILSSGELCACEILEHFNLTQPTISHHLGILVNSGLLSTRVEGKWTHYNLQTETLASLQGFLQKIAQGNGRPIGRPRRNCT